MTTEVAQHIPLDANGLPVLLTKSLSRQDLEHHRGKIGFFAEFLAKKYNRFGWDDMAQELRSAIRLGYMNKLQDYPMDEIHAACEACEVRDTKRAPTDIEIREEIRARRERKLAIIRARRPVPREPDRPTPMSAEDAERVLRDAGFTPKRFEGAKRNRMATDWEAMEAGERQKETPREEYMTPAEIEAEDRRAAG